MKNVVKRCEFEYDKIIKGKTNRKCIQPKINDLRVFLECDDDEDFYNTACYKKCPPLFKDAGPFCIKEKYY